MVVITELISPSESTVARKHFAFSVVKPALPPAYREILWCSGGGDFAIRKLNSLDLIERLEATEVGTFVNGWNMHDKRNSTVTNLTLPAGAAEDENYIEWDLGEVKSVLIYAYWKVNYTAAIGILKVSTDGSTWSTIGTINETTGTEFLWGGTARYIRLTGSNSDSSDRTLSVYSLEAYKRQYVSYGVTLRYIDTDAPDQYATGVIVGKGYIAAYLYEP